MAKGKYKRRRLRQQRRSTPIRDSTLSERVVRILEAYGINTLYDLDMTTDETFHAMPRVGEKAMTEIHAVQINIPFERDYTKKRSERK